MNKIGYLTACVMLLALSCSREPKPIETQFFASVSVPDSLDSTGDFSGFEFLIYNRVNPSDPIDTLLIAETDSLGALEGIIEVDQSGVYPVQITRYGRNIASLRLLVAEDDTIRLSTEFPDIENTLQIDSREQRAMDSYDRVNGSYARVNAYIQAGQVPAEDIPAELQKWANLYFEVFQEHFGTLAGKFALEGAINIWNVIDRPEMMRKLQDSFEEEYAYGLAATLGKDYVASTKGLEATVAYLDSVKSLTQEEEIRKAIEQSVIKLYLDSLDIQTSKELLTRYEKEYEDEENYSFWFKNLRFELYELTPGEPAPEIYFTTSEGDTVTNASLMGAPVILEFTTMANPLYQQQYDESTLVYQFFADQGLQYYTIPFDESAVTIVSFFDERDRFWSLADPPSFNKKEMVDKFNIQYYPTRILIDADGNMVRKYIGEEFDGIIPGINETLN